MNKKILAMTIALILLSTGAYAATQISQVNYNPSPAVPGSTITLIVQVENPDNTAQKGITLSIDNEYPFTAKSTENMPNPKEIGEITAHGTTQATFTIYIDPTAENKTYNIPITLSTAGSGAVKSEHPIIIGGKEPLLKILGVSNQNLLPGEEKEIILTIQNVGTSPAYDVTVEMQEDRTVTATGVVVERDITPLGAATAYIQGINPGEQKTATLTVSVNNTAVIKNYTLPVTLTYRDAAGTRLNNSSDIGLQVYGNAELDAELKTITGTIASGQSTKITLEIFNKGLGKAEFVITQISTPDGTIEKTRQFIGTLGPNDVDTIETNIMFNKTGNQTITITIQYQDADSTMKTTTIQVPIIAQTTTGENANNTIILAVVIIVIVVLVWNFGFRGKKKK